MKRATTGKFLIAASVALMLLFTLRIGLRAQVTELLQNTTFDSYYGIGGANVAPAGWTLSASVPVGSAKQNWIYNEFPGFLASWEVSTTKAAFTMIARQFVPGIRSGTPLRFSVYSNQFTCDKENSCIEGGVGYRVSDRSSGAQTRIGVDPTGGQDPNSPNVVWSAFIQPFDQFQQAIIDFQSKNDNGVTLYLYATQSVGMLLNKVYWDNASLIVLGPGGALPPGATEAPKVVPFVTPQGQQADGSIVHIVQKGDTLSSIAFAYKIDINELRKLNNIPLDEYVIVPGQKLIIKPATGPLPAVTYIIVTATHTPDPRTPTLAVSPTPSPTATLTPTKKATGTPPVIVITLAPPTPTKSAFHFHFRAPGDEGVILAAYRDAGALRGPARQSDSELASVCVRAFDDQNGNAYQDAGEVALPGALLQLSGADDLAQTRTTGDEAVCFAGLAPGAYRLAVEAPAGLRLTTPGELRLRLGAGAPLDLAIGARPGEAEAPAVPESAGGEAIPVWAQTLRDNAGILVVGAAGVVLLAGIGISLLARS